MKKLILLALLAHSAVAEVIFGGYTSAPIQMNQTFGAVFAFLNSNPSDAHLLSAYQTDIIFSSNLAAQSITELGDFATYGIGLSGYTIDNPNGRISGLIEALTGGGGLYAGNLFQIDFIATQAGPAFIRYDGLLAVDTDFNFIDTTLIPVEFTILPTSAQEVPESSSLTLVGLGIALFAVLRWRRLPIVFATAQRRPSA